MQVFIIEDEELSVERLQKQLIEIDPSIIIAGMEGSVKRAVQWLKNNVAPDVILMDIELGDGQCFNIFRQTEITSQVIFITSFDESAMLVFRKNNLQYLLKPVKKADLRNALEHCTGNIHNNNCRIDIESLIAAFKKQEYKRNFRSRLLVKQGHSILAVETSTIAYIYMDRRYCFVKTWDGETYSIQHTLDVLEEMLHPNEFNRINTEFIIHRKSISAVHQQNGSAKITLQPETEKEIRLNHLQLQSLLEWKN